MLSFPNRSVLFLAYGGSHAYGLATMESDIDYRGVWIDTSTANLLGSGRSTVHQELKDDVDLVMAEYRHVLHLLKVSSNTGAIELLFQHTNFQSSEIWRKTQSAAHQLIDSDQLYKSLCGYILSEKDLAIGKRIGKLGGKRQTAISKWGFSPKNFVQLFRLAHAGRQYLLTGNFPVNIAIDNHPFAEFLLEIKTHPENFTREMLELIADKALKALMWAHEQKKFSSKFSDAVAEKLLWEAYYPEIQKIWKTNEAV